MRPGQSPSRSGDDAQVAGRRRAFLRVTEADRAQAGHELLGFLQRAVTVRHPAAGGNQVLHRLGEVLVRAVVDLARALGLRSVAEGVEAQWQLDRLIEIGCDGAQGYLLGHPADVPAEEPAVPIELSPRP